MVRLGLWALVLASCGAPVADDTANTATRTTATGTTVPTSATTAPATPSLTAEEQIWLATHNAARTRYGRVALQWDDTLERDARIWAQHLAQTGTFEHSKERNGQGENLWMGTRGAYLPASMVGSWVEEEAYLKSGTFPDVSTTGNWADVGHATQILWPSTTRVGCAKASSASADYFVCRYTPPGNWRGEGFDARRR